MANAAAGNPQFQKPSGYAPDSLTNNEVGWKTEWFDHRVQFNGSVYRMNWNDVQLLFFNPVALGNTTFGVNGPNYRIDGLELQLVFRVTEGLTVQGSSCWNSANQTTSPCLISNIAASPTNGQCITEVKGVPFLNPYGALNTVPPFSPPFEYNLRARYALGVQRLQGVRGVWRQSRGPYVQSAGDLPGR